MLATTTVTWALLIANISGASNQLQAMTSIQGFGSQEACQAAARMTLDALPSEVKKPFVLCLPVDAARPMPGVLMELIQPGQ